MRTIKKDNIHKTLPAPKHRHKKHDKETVQDSYMAIKDRLRKPENSIKYIAHQKQIKRVDSGVTALELSKPLQNKAKLGQP